MGATLDQPGSVEPAEAFYATEHLVAFEDGGKLGKRDTDHENGAFQSKICEVRLTYIFHGENEVGVVR